MIPMLATLVTEPFSREGWVNEEKYDGYRALAYVDKTVRIFSRNENLLTGGFPEIASALERLSGAPFILDGEIVALDRGGISRFQLLQRREQGESIRPIFAAFDCLQREGKSLLKATLADRRKALEGIVPAGRNGTVIRSRRISRDGLAAYAEAGRRGWEGIVAKRESSTYQPGVRSRDWLKVKVRKESEFVIGGFTAPAGSRDHFGALLVGLFEAQAKEKGRALRYVGKVGTGYTQKTLADLAARMRPLRTDRSPFAGIVREKGATWVNPVLVAQVTFGEWTDEGKLRQPVFLGLRNDKKAADCRWSDREA